MTNPTPTHGTIMWTELMTRDLPKAAGGEIRRPPFDIPGIGRIAMIADPTGAALGLMTPAS